MTLDNPHAGFWRPAPSHMSLLPVFERRRQAAHTSRSDVFCKDSCLFSWITVKSRVPLLAESFPFTVFTMSLLLPNDPSAVCDCRCHLKYPKALSAGNDSTSSPSASVLLNSSLPRTNPSNARRSLTKQVPWTLKTPPPAT